MGERGSQFGLRCAEDRSRWLDVQLHRGLPVLVATVQGNTAAFADLRHATRKRVVAADSLSEYVATFRFLLDEHPARVRRGSGLQCQFPQRAVAFVDEVADREALMRELLHVVGE